MFGQIIQVIASSASHLPGGTHRNSAQREAAHAVAFEALAEGAAHLRHKVTEVKSQREALAIIKEMLDWLDRNFKVATYAEVRKHLDYLAGKAEVTTERLLIGDTISVPAQVLDDALLNIGNILKETSAPLPVDNTDIVERIIEASATELEGWCTADKARILAKYIEEEKPDLCIEIGVFGGRSLFPCAAALKSKRLGYPT